MNSVHKAGLNKKLSKPSGDVYRYKQILPKEFSVIYDANSFITSFVPIRLIDEETLFCVPYASVDRFQLNCQKRLPNKLKLPQSSNTKGAVVPIRHF